MASVANCSKGRYRLLLLEIRCFPTAVILALTILSGAAVAQSARAAQQGRDTEILFLGTAGGPPLHEERSEPSTVLIVDGREYLIDCGIGTMRRMLQAGIQSEQIKTIFFTHLHPDHALGLADVLANDFLRLNMAAAGQTIDIYGPPQTKELVDSAFRYITIPFSGGFTAEGRLANEIKSPFLTHEVERDGLVYEDDRIRVTAAENAHYALMSADLRQRMKSYSYRIETPHGVVVFTGDTGPSDAVAQLARGADVLVAEASYRDAVDLDRFVNSMATQNHWPAARIKVFRAHFEFEHLDSNAVGELASKAQVKSVLLYHYDPVDKADQVAYVNGAKGHFPGPVFASADLDRYCLGARTDRQSPGARNLSRCAESQ
jgi:ribonuclease BN (tRNA processing enzyme)